MPAVDALLHLMVAEGADALTLADGAVPELSKGGQTRALSMAPLGAEMLSRFIEEVRSEADGRYYVLEGKGVRTTFEVSIGETGRLEFRLVADPCATGRGSAVAGPARAEAPPVAAAATTGPLEHLVARALEARASDLFVSTSADARIRVGGRLHEIAGSRCDPEAILSFFEVAEPERARLEADGSVDLALDVPGGRVRANVFRHQGGLAAAVRPVRRVQSLKDLGLPADLRALTDYHDGLVLMVGPAGSGKSTTLAALVDHLNRTHARHVVTIEDPIEFEYEPGRCLIHQREVGRHVDSFAAGLWAALRESPDVILLGEMRGPDTIAAALTAAETGHLVLSTLHSGGAAMAVDRIIDAFAPHQQAQVRSQLASVLRAVLTQVLLPGARVGTLVPALEKLLVTPAIAHAIRDNRGYQIGSQIQTGRDDGMVSLELSLADLVRRRSITRDTAVSAARDADLLHKLLGA